jgi:tRNA (guanine26-N2/guanine27-N2)-dimethyltransferase
MCRTVRCTPPRAEQLRSAIINAGFRVSGSHANPLALKTDAPPKVVWDIIRCWVKLHPIKPPEPGSYPANILSKEVETEADFRKAAGAVPESVKAGVKRFVQNPAFWGPKARHGRPLKPEQQKQQLAQAEQRRTRQQQQGQGAAAAGSSGSSGGAAAGGSNGTAAAAAAGAAAAEQEDAAEQEQQQQQQQDEAAAAAAAAGDGGDLLSMLYDKEDAEAERPPKKARKVPAAAGSS